MNNKEIELFKLRNEYFHLTVKLREYEYFINYASEDIKDFETEKEKQEKLLKKLKNKFEKTKKECPDFDFIIYSWYKRYIMAESSVKATENMIFAAHEKIKQWQILKEKIALKLKENQKAVKELETEIKKFHEDSND